MTQRLSGIGVLLLTFLPAVSLAQTTGQAARPTPAPGEADPGVRPTRIIDRAEVRLSRVDLQPGAVRRVHAHDDVEYHLWVPLTGSLEITIGSDAPVPAAAGQAFFMKKGTLHGFRNTGTTPAAVFEIFVKQTTTARGRLPDEIDAVLAWLGLGAPAGRTGDQPWGGGFDAFTRLR